MSIPREQLATAATACIARGGTAQVYFGGLVLAMQHQARVTNGQLEGRGPDNESYIAIAVEAIDAVVLQEPLD